MDDSAAQEVLRSIQRLLREAFSKCIGDVPDEVALENPFPGVSKAVVDTKTGVVHITLARRVTFIRLTLDIDSSPVQPAGAVGHKHNGGE